MAAEVNQNSAFPKSVNVPVPAKKRQEKTWIYQMNKLKMQQKNRSKRNSEGYRNGHIYPNLPRYSPS